ncbi:RHS repeat-associated core domain-containing protein [Streptomyces chrestomyceticus]|uniref:RHS repeat-associated core domain-containing protein n=1 Tax=Streptomyces chrestomyceticus TaxID=68185 RepID=UPI0033EC7489
MAGALLQVTSAPPAPAADTANRPGLPAAEKPVSGKAVSLVKPRTLQQGPRTPREAPKASWPRPGTAIVDLAQPAARPAAPAQAAGLPLSLTPAPQPGAGKAAGTAAAARTAAPTAVTAQVLDHQRAQRAGLDGMLFTLTPQPAPKTAAAAPQKAAVGVTVSYADFAGAYGGSYAARLRLLQLPACALTTPDKPVCRTATPLPTANDTEQHTLTASAVGLRQGAPTVLAAAAADKGDKSDYKATSLSPSATWNTNLNTGDFTWSYPMPVPDVPGGLKPAVGLSYTSGALDGRTGTTNNQASWAGDGFEMWPGFIERRYKPCADDDVKNADGNKPADLCWGYDNAFLTFNGKAGELVPAGDNTWKLKGDDGTRIKKLTSADRANGDNDNEYWELTDPKGTRYYFGYHRLPGWSAGKETTDSTWTVPVFGDDSGEPCHAAAFKDAWCQQAWRWNLDFIVDTHNNAVSYFYGKETNSYGRNLKEDDDTPYIRGGYLKRTDYGQQAADLYTGKPLARVNYTSAERCLPQAGVTCEPDTIDAKAFYWYDTPWDLNCKAATKCDNGRSSPTFWTRKRLTAVTTEVLKDNAYAKVDSWALSHRWGSADVDYQLLLEAVQHTGHSAAPAVTLPKTTLAYTQLANRLDKTGDGYAPFIKARLSTVADESGGQLDVNYSAPACSFDKLPTPQTNTTRCYPQYLGGTASDDPDRQWFNKYLVTSVTATDRTGGAPDQVTRYEYLGDAAWHFDDDDGLTKEKFKTWSQWRGYGHVRVKTGGQGADGMKTQADTYFLRGMDGDRKDTAGGTKAVTVALADGEGDALTDHPAAVGYAYKTATYSGPSPGGKVLTKTVNRPWHHETAKKVRDWGTITANLTGTAHTRTFTSLDDGNGAKWRTTAQATTFETVAGRATQHEDLADETTAADDRCTRTTYATNTDKNILTTPSRVETVAVTCAATPDRAKDVLSDQRTAYDNAPYGTAPTKGDATAAAVLKKHDGTTATYLEAGATFDAYGRPLTTTDLSADLTARGDATPARTPRTDGRTTTTTYTPATGFPATTTQAGPPATDGDATTAQTTTTETDPLRGQPTATTDTNGKRTTLTYDALGRAYQVWLPDRRTDLLPTYQFNYRIEEGKPVAVTTRTLDEDGGKHLTAHTLFDGFQHPRQTQAPGPDGGRLLSDTFYDERGLTAKTFAPYYTTGAPAPTLFAPDNALSVESQTRHTYDGLGRETEARQIAGNGDGGTVLAVTQTRYGGDRTTVIPPEGATATTTLTDARGQTTELRQHHTRTADAPYDTTRYTRTPAGQLATVTDPAGNTWTYTYDQLGRQIRTTDPDKGTTTATFDDRGQQTTTTDARGTTLATVYDNLGRKTALREKSADGPLRAKWVYDTLPGAKGQLTEATRYVKGQPYTRKVTQYDRLYRIQRAATVIPPAEGALAGTYTDTTAYRAGGLVGSRGYSAAGSLPGGGWSYTYQDQTLRPVAVYDGRGVRADVTYSLTGKALQYQLGGTKDTYGIKKTWATNTYEWGTQRLATARVDRQDQAGVDRYATYGYDPAGNVTAISDVSRTGTDTQCFAYDHLRRLSQAWAQGDKTCAQAPAANLLGGPAPYWQSYTYDKVGNRLTETQHDPAGDAAKDTTRTYAYPGPGKPQSHTLTSVTTTGPTGTAKDTYGYDPAGNTTSRILSGDEQSLTWDSEGHLEQVTQPAKDGGAKQTTTYLYDADGARLIARTPAKTTLYLGTTELTLRKDAAKAEATRYLPLGGGHQAVLADDGTYTVTLADHQDTGQLAVTTADLALQQRRTTPFGSPRGTAPKTWPGTKGFVGGTDDTGDTGLVHLGAREYDPAIGRFLSVDPVMDLADPQQINGYTYGNNNPATSPDPTGLMPGGCEIPGNCYGYAPGGHGCPHGCGTTDNVKWGTSQSRRSGGASSKSQGIQLGNSTLRLPVSDTERVPHAFFERLNAKMIETESKWMERGDGPLTAREVASLAMGACFDTKDCTDEQLGYLFDAYWSSGGDVAAFGNDRLGAADIPGITTVSSRMAGSKFRAAQIRPCHSFLPGTEVLLSDGTRKNIEDVEVGDEVSVADPETGETASRPVVGVISTEGDKNFTSIEVTSSGLKNSIIATDTHPFWSETDRRWIRAGDLQAGTQLRTPQGHSAQVTAVRRFQQQQRTHDLTIRGIHAYYALAGSTPLLVHNCEFIDPTRILFAQKGVSSRFKNGKTIDETVAGIKSGAIDPMDFPPIRLVVRDGKLYTLDHRRLVTFQKAGLSKVPYRMATSAEEMAESFKFDPGAAQSSIKIRGTGETWKP